MGDPWSKQRAERLNENMQSHSLSAGEASRQEYGHLLVTTLNKAVQHLTLKLAALIFNQLIHSLLKCKLYLNLHVYLVFFTRAPPESSHISTSDPCFLPAVLHAQILIALFGCRLPS